MTTSCERRKLSSAVQIFLARVATSLASARLDVDARSRLARSPRADRARDRVARAVHLARRRRRRAHNLPRRAAPSIIDVFDVDVDDANLRVVVVVVVVPARRERRGVQPGRPPRAAQGEGRAAGRRAHRGDARARGDATRRGETTRPRCVLIDSHWSPYDRVRAVNADP
eukprot:30904-Pelagococcus_subviridis.AAC.7